MRGERCKWVCLDIDGTHGKAEHARDAVLALIATCRKFGLLPRVELSGGKGWHVWLFCQELHADLARAVGLGVVRETGEEQLIGTQEVAVFPKQVQVGEEGFGNLVKLPWGRRADNGAKGQFVHPDTLERLAQDDQVALLQAVVLHTESEWRELVAQNAWGMEAPRPARESNGILARNTFRSELPCYEMICDVDLAAQIPTGHRNNVLFAFASQKKRQGSSEKVALRDVLMINQSRCSPPADEREVRKTVASCYKSQDSAACCDIIQKASLCPVLLHGVACPIFNKVEEKREQSRRELNADETRLTIQPLRVSRGSPPIYTATVRGRELRLSLKELKRFDLFQERCLGELDFIPQLPVVYTKVQDDEGNWKRKQKAPSGVWHEIVNAAMESVIPEDAPPEDASPQGAVWDAVCEFLAERKIHEDREKLLSGQVVTENGCYVFRGRDLRRWLKLTGTDLLSEHELWLLIRDRGGENGLLKVKRKPVRVWKIPTERISPPGDAGEEDVTAERFEGPPLGLLA